MPRRDRTVIRQALEVAELRIRATVGHRWRAYVALVVLIGFLGGLGLGGLAAARRTQSSFSTFLATTNPSNITITVYGAQSGSTGNPDYDPALTSAIARLPGVRHVAPGFVVIGAPLEPDGTPRIRVTGLAYPVASVNGLYYSQDRVAVTAGRMAATNRANEIMMAPVVAKLLGFHVGQTIPFGFYSNAEENQPGFGTAAVKPALRITMHLVGLAESSAQIVEDDVDTFPTFIPLTPAFTREVFARNLQLSGGLTFGIQTDRGTSLVPQVEREIARLIPPGQIYTSHALAPVTAKADRSLRPISIALGVFGAVTLLAALLVAAQLIALALADRERRPAGAARVGRQSRRHPARPAPRVGGCHRRRDDPRRRPRRRLVAHRTARPGAFRLPRRWRRVRLDRAGVRHADPPRRADGDRGGPGPARRAAPRGQPRPPGVRLGGTHRRLRGTRRVFRHRRWSGCVWRSSQVRAAAPSRFAQRSSGRSSP